VSSGSKAPKARGTLEVGQADLERGPRPGGSVMIKGVAEPTDCVWGPAVNARRSLNGKEHPTVKGAQGYFLIIGARSQVHFLRLLWDQGTEIGGTKDDFDSTCTVHRVSMSLQRNYCEVLSRPLEEGENLRGGKA